MEYQNFIQGSTRHVPERPLVHGFELFRFFVSSLSHFAPSFDLARPYHPAGELVPGSALVISKSCWINFGQSTD